MWPILYYGEKKKTQNRRQNKTVTEKQRIKKIKKKHLRNKE